ncbi:phosphatidylcholine and lysophosphatidylcholine phospholipase [Friedmanniomyces endolithicus]|nr:phosphatidylcholine and lysophosphatidylcholine phospholipase [Friedmanniomyces endolithicus]KAK0299288.1 phosphatidylcholine and lysophosphatidylcholine phospholipase [Friedmanniomyces endolithicus]KAK1016790.1 phosphatidylcholine and lysophosphatidylcholine phospholipase [Friedmanniomyces endolithicus]
MDDLSILSSTLQVSSSIATQAYTTVSTAAAAAITATTAGSSTTIIYVPASPQSALGMIGGLLLGLLTVVPSVLYWTVTFLSLTLPTWLFTFLSTSLTFTMNMTTILLVVVSFASTVAWFVRYRFLNMYSRLPPQTQRKEPQIEIFPDAQETDSKPGLSNYFDEFLSAIKVFGYLERPVFHELTRTMQTRKLIAGETLLLEEEKGFCLVVDGLVQIFVKAQRAPNYDWGHDSSEFALADDDNSEERASGNRSYQLLTEVKNGAPMSSLFSILALFTETVKLRYDESEDTPSDMDRSGLDGRQPVRYPFPHLDGSATPDSGADSPWPGGASRPPSRHRRTSTMKEPPHLTLDVSPEGLHINLESSRQHSTARPPNHIPRRLQKRTSAHPDIVARAAVDTTIAIIPASAFHRITKIYPKATAHIVQVIITRLQRVTLGTVHSYLGLTSQVLSTERLMDRYTTYDLPDFLRGQVLQRLKDKFRKDQERVGPEESVKGIALHNPRQAQRRRRASSSLQRETAINAAQHAARSGNPQAHHVDSDRGGVSAGDLLTNIHAARTPGRPRNAGSFSQPYSAPKEANGHALLDPEARDTFHIDQSPRAHMHRQESMDEDLLFRESIMECMAKAIGLSNTKSGVGNSASAAQSPRLVSFDPKRQSAVFNNAFGFMDSFEGSADDTESLHSVSAYSSGGSVNILEDLKNEVEIVFFPKDSVLVEEGERNPGLYYVIDGFLDVSATMEGKDGHEDMLGTRPGAGRVELPDLLGEGTARRGSSSGKKPHSTAEQQRRKRQSRQSLFLIKPGGLAGYLGSVSSYRSFINVTAKTDVYVGFLPRVAVDRIVERYPIVLLTMAKRLTSLLPRLIQHIDFALEWVQVDAGQAIYHQNDESDAIYIVLNGRLRAIQEDKDGKMQVIGEYGQGDSVGELEVLTESTRPGTLHAIRDSELAKFPKTLFNSLAQEHPGITIKVSKIIASRMRALIENPMTEPAATESKLAVSRPKSTSTMNLRTVAIVPCTAGVPVVEFSNKLQAALVQIGTVNGVTTLNQSSILNHLGRHAFSKLGKLKLSQYLADLEEKYGLVLYVADTSVKSPWTQTCISQADCIYLVGLAEGSPSIGEYERFLLTTKTTARKELILLHPERYCPPGTTRTWLRNRPWINGGHHHVQLAFRTNPEQVHHSTPQRFGRALKHRVQVLQAEIHKYTSRRVRQTPLYSAETPFKGDFHRLARRLCNKSVGLVLGGGGARGLAHVGIIRALEEAGLPIDMVGGTSIGAFIGAVYAQDADVVPMYGRVKKFAGRMASFWRFALDVTYPSASYTTGHEFNRGIFKTFGDAQIEDFWLAFYCNSTNISKSRSEIHTSGYVWRYVRASMSLAGLLPPMCDEGSMLLDGGYVDNLTVSHMKSLGAEVIFAVDVGALDDDTPQAYGDSLSGFWASINRWNPFSSFPNPPTLSEIQARLAYVSSVDALERAKNIPGCRFMRPPIEAYGTLEFGKFEEIYQVGYQFGRRYLEGLREEGVLPVTEETEERRKLRRTMAPRRASI